MAPRAISVAIPVHSGSNGGVGTSGSHSHGDDGAVSKPASDGGGSGGGGGTVVMAVVLVARAVATPRAATRVANPRTTSLVAEAAKTMVVRGATPVAIPGAISMAMTIRAPMTTPAMTIIATTSSPVRGSVAALNVGVVVPAPVCPKRERKQRKHLTVSVVKTTMAKQTWSTIATIEVWMPTRRGRKGEAREQPRVGILVVVQPREGHIKSNKT